VRFYSFYKRKNRCKVIGNMILGTIFGPLRDEVERKWRKLHCEELHISCALSNTITIILSRGIRWACCVARIGETRSATQFGLKNMKERDNLEDVIVDYILL
jgi:hypothetical protein